MTSTTTMTNTMKPIIAIIFCLLAAGCNVQSARLPIAQEIPGPVVINAFLDASEDHYRNRDDGALARTFLGDRGAILTFTYRRMNAAGFTAEEVRLRRVMILDRGESKTPGHSTVAWDVEARNQRSGPDQDMPELAAQLAAAVTKGLNKAP